jgi:hypothetical protein
MNPKIWLAMLLIGALLMAVNLINRTQKGSGEQLQNT